ncbi:uncharacterized protein LOC123528436 [Mercenaria mercenaria]|uniref:uncharacterized protein LOC123528436 n=1 Tax=Mercenaria mercenaria TaxID=6596 RepID=UPI00234F6934|nr:uncharacterized protein LOC123528436 [Mercenaria mercenaria]
MKKSILFLLLQGCSFKLVAARLDTIVTSSSCDEYYNMEDIKEAYVTYNGTRLKEEECIVQFINYRTFTRQTCVKPLSLQISCNTKVEYYRMSFSISNNLEPKKLISCANASYDEWCGPTRTTYLYILFRTSWGSSDDYIQLHVYLKDLPKEDDLRNTDTNDSTSDTATWPLVIGVASIFIVGIIFVISCKRASERPPLVYQTTGGQLIMQIDQGNMNPAQSMIGCHPPQQPQGQPPVDGSFQMYPVQNAFPVPTKTEAECQSHVSFQNPSAPLSASADPPSYESVAK